MLKLLSLLLILMIANKAFGDTFIVTSNAASGSGTLQNALLQAAQNGANAKDIIRFNLPNTNRSDRTILVSSPLPFLTSNLVINGFTQPGSSFGASNAKVEIDVIDGLQNGQLFSAENASNIEIYGLYLKGTEGSTYALHLKKVSHVIFGASGKGNLVNGFSYALYSKENTTESRDIIIQGNLFGTNESGTALDNNFMDNVVDFTNVKDVLLGGDNAGEGNLICSKLYPININFNARGTPGFLKIHNNKIGADISGLQKIEETKDATINFFGVNENDYDNGVQTGTTYLKIEIADNIIANRINLFKIRDTFFIKGNHFGLGADNSANIGSNFTSTILIQECGPGIIGGNREEDKNYFANNQTAILEAYTGNVTISHNSFRCNTVAGIRLYVWSYFRPQPFINVTSLSATSISGNALPNSTIELYENDNCGIICEGKIFLASVKADGLGNWSYTGIGGKDVIATATDVYGATSEFSRATINEINTQVADATCGKNNGSIKNIQILSGTAWHWENEDGNVVGNDSNLVNMTPGKYRLVVDIGTATCSFKSNLYTIGDAELPQAPPVVKTINVDCGQATGSLSTPALQGFTATWFINGNIIDTGFAIEHLLPADYYLKLSAVNDTSCSQTFGPYKISNLSGNSLDITNIKIINASCDNSNGSIANIQFGAANAYIEWDNEAGNIVATGSLKLSGVPAGKYRLKVKGTDNCDTIITPFYIIKNAGIIIIDSSQMKISGTALCAATGAIEGIKPINGDTFIWQTNDGTTIGLYENIDHLTTGDYTLVVGNQYHCKATSFPVHVPTVLNSDWQSAIADIQLSDCSLADGYIHVTNIANASSYEYRWVDATQPNITFSNTLNLDPAPNGSFILYATDANGCEDTVMKTVVATASPTPVIDTSNKEVKDEICNGKSGSISGIALNGGTKPLAIAWSNDIQNIVSTNEVADNLPAGIYQLTVKDAAGCIAKASPIKIQNKTVNYEMPVYKEMLIPKHTTATLAVINFQEGTYSLFDDSFLKTPIQQNTTGLFTTDELTDDKVFYVMVSSGDCKSSTAIINIKVADATKVFVPTAFTPNGDGKNDILKPVISGIFSLNEFVVYNRLGQAIFHTKDINNGWKGDSNGTPSDDGTYVWIIKGKDGNGKLVFVKGVTVLVR